MSRPKNISKNEGVRLFEEKDKMDTPTKANRSPQVELDAYSIEEFCRRHSISRATYYNMKIAGKGPREGHVLGRIIITKEAAHAWREKITTG